MNNETLLVIFVGLTGVALMVQAIIMLVAFLTMRKSIVNIQSEFVELKTTLLPILMKSKETLDRVAPKIESVAADAAELTRTVKEQTQQFQVVAAEILDRVHRQTSRVDNMFTSVIDGVERTTNVVAETVSRPVRQATAMLAGAKAFLTALASGRRPDSRVEVVTDQDMFV